MKKLKLTNCEFEQLKGAEMKEVNGGFGFWWRLAMKHALQCIDAGATIIGEGGIHCTDMPFK